MVNEQLSDEEKRTLSSSHCIDCGYCGFVLGPQGGASMNIECGNIKCGARFNIVRQPTYHGVAFAHRIPKQSEGGSDWGKVLNANERYIHNVTALFNNGVISANFDRDLAGTVIIIGTEATLAFKEWFFKLDPK